MVAAIRSVATNLLLLCAFGFIPELYARRSEIGLSELKEGPDGDSEQLDMPESRMPKQIAGAMKLHMPSGKTMSVGFEFECTNKEYWLTRFMPEDWPDCPAVEFPMDGVSKAKPKEMLPEFFGLDPRADDLDMNNYPAMPECVRNIVWTKDAYAGDHGPDCLMDPTGQGVAQIAKVPNRGAVLAGRIFNNGECGCKYTLEFKTLPVHTRGDLRTAMIGAGLTLAATSEKNGQSLEDWNVDQLFIMEAPLPGQGKTCTGSTHVTKAFVINRKSLLDILKQQMIGYCVRKWPKETSGNKVYRTSFVEAYMLWRAMQTCQGQEDCLESRTLTDVCSSKWGTPAEAQADVEAALFASKAEKDDMMGTAYYHLYRARDSPSDEFLAGMPCSPGKMLSMACAGEFGTLDQILTDAEKGFGQRTRGLYYGPGGAEGGDTTTKIGAMLSEDGKSLYGLAEHRKDLWNTKSFKKCLYTSLMSSKSVADAEDRFDRSIYCKNALEKATQVDYSA